jgi:hypothetical protein
VLEAAVNGKADALVTHNRRDFEPAARAFGLRVLLPLGKCWGSWTYPLKLPTSVKTAAVRLAKADGVSLKQFIAAAVAENVGVMETAREFLERRAGKAKPRSCLSTCARLDGRSRRRRINDSQQRRSPRSISTKSRSGAALRSSVVLG